MSYREVNTWPKTSFQYIYVKKNSSSEYAGDVLAGCYFGPKFSLKQIANFSETEKQKYPDAENLYHFYHDGYITFNLSEIVFLSGSQAYAYKRNLEECWLEWEPYMKKIWIENKIKEEA